MRRTDCFRFDDVFRLYNPTGGDLGTADARKAQVQREDGVNERRMLDRRRGSPAGRRALELVGAVN
jgi:hypothetical protein